MLSPGVVFDRYRIEAELGAGGMGRVYRAFDSRLQRHVALKVLLAPDAASPEEQAESSARMLREARAAAAFEHPGKVAVYDVGQHDGLTYIAMELVVGKTLRAFVGPGEASLSQRVTWLQQTAEVLAAAHRAGLVHRDVKPENVMVREDGTVKVLDFGIARRMARSVDPDGKTELGSVPTLTQKGASVGTPIYMAPEQIHAEPLDGRADQFAWGTMAYELLCGKHPWASGRDVLAAIAAIISEPTPAFPQDLLLGDEVKSTVSRALSKSRADRFSSFEDLTLALSGASTTLRAALAPSFAPSTAPAGAVPLTTRAAVVASLAPPTRLRGRLRAFATGAIGAIGALALLAGGAFVWSRSRHAESELKPPGVGLHAIEVYRNPRGADVASLDSTSFWNAATQDFERALRQPGAPARWQSAKLVAEAQQLLLREHVDEAISKLRAAVKLEPDWAVARTVLASALSRAGRTDEALRSAEEAQRLEPNWWPAVASAARVNAYSRRLNEAIQDYRRALQIAPNHPYLLGELALVYHAARLDPEAERFAKQALELDPDLLAPRVMLAERALERGDGEAALAEATRAVAVLPKSVPGKLAVADALALLGRSDEARAQYRSAVEAWEEQGGGGPLAQHMVVVKATLLRGELPARALPVSDGARSPAAAAPAPVQSRTPAPRAPAPRTPAPRTPSAGSDRSSAAKPDLQF